MQTPLPRFCLIGLCVLVSACASTPQLTFDETAQQWVGRTEAALVAGKGQPNKTLIRSYEDGELIEKTLEYTGASAIDTAPQAANRQRAVLVNGQWVMVPDNSLTESGKAAPVCKLTFKVDAKLIVRSWAAEGKDCRG